MRVAVSAIKRVPFVSSVDSPVRTVPHNLAFIRSEPIHCTKTHSDTRVTVQILLECQKEFVAILDSCIFPHLRSRGGVDDAGYIRWNQLIEAFWVFSLILPKLQDCFHKNVARCSAFSNKRVSPSLVSKQMRCKP